MILIFRSPNVPGTSSSSHFQRRLLSPASALADAANVLSITIIRGMPYSSAIRTNAIRTRSQLSVSPQYQPRILRVRTSCQTPDVETHDAPVRHLDEHVDQLAVPGDAVEREHARDSAHLVGEEGERPRWRPCADARSLRAGSRGSTGRGTSSRTESSSRASWRAPSRAASTRPSPAPRAGGSPCTRCARRPLRQACSTRSGDGPCRAQPRRSRRRHLFQRAFATA